MVDLKDSHGKLKLLLVSPLPPPAGGIQTVTETIMSYFKNTDHEAEIILYNSSHRFRSSTSRSLTVRIITGTGNSLKTFFGVRRLIRKKKPGLVHLSSSASLALIRDLIIARYCRRRGIPVIMHWHFGRIPELVLKNNWEWRLMRNVITLSTMSIVIDARSFKCLEGLKTGNIAYIPNPLPLQAERRMDAIRRKIYNNKRDNINPGRIIYVGHVIREKGVYELVSACTPDTRVKELMLVGKYENKVKDELTLMAFDRPGREWFTMTGEIGYERVLELIETSAILVLPSYTEGFPMVVAEAMALGCPVIATGVGAIPEMLDISSGEPCGLCVPARDAASIGDAVSQMITDRGMQVRMGENGMKRISAGYTSAVVAEKYLEVWRRIAQC